MADNPLFIGTARAEGFQFVPGHDVRPRIVFTPGALGAEIEQINISSTDNAERLVSIGIARKITDGDDVGSGAFVDGGGGDDTITRSAGSFITDGWLVGNRIMVQGATTLADDFEAFLTTVAALTLGVTTTTLTTAEVMLAATNLYRLNWLTWLTVPAGSGVPSVVPVSGLDIVQMPSLDASPDRRLTLGTNDLLVAKLDAALTSDEVVDFSVIGGDY